MSDKTQGLTIEQARELMRARLERAQAIIEHNREMLKLRSNGQAHRDRLLAARLDLRRDA